jgi:hypothetical protein
VPLDDVDRTKPRNTDCLGGLIHDHRMAADLGRWVLGTHGSG